MTIDEAISHAREVAECQKMSARLIEDNAYIPESVDKEAITHGNTICADEHEQLAEWLEELKQYRAIGTIEECRAAVEKQKAKKIVRVKLGQSEWGSEYRCPVCESDLIKTVFFNEDGTEPNEKISWCSGCGQKLDWRDEE